MCLSCEGWSDDEVHALLDSRIRASGWTTVTVGERHGGPTWTYTVGLAGVDHPDLLIATVTPERATTILGDIADRVVDGERVDTTDQVTYLDQSAGHVRDVHPVHVERGLVGTGQRYYDRVGLPAARLRVRQVVLPDSEFCDCHAVSQPRLHLAHTLFGVRGPTRAERRSARRRRRGSR